MRQSPLVPVVCAALLSACADPTMAGSDAASEASASANDGSANASDAGAMDGAANEPTVRVPIEVLGATGTVESVTVRANSDRASAAYLWLNTHRLTWREDGEFASTTAPRNNVRPRSKGSVRLNGGPWVGLTNATVTCEAHEAALGCLNGSYMAVRVRVALDRLGAPGLRDGDNTVEFRFDETDGISSGWRVLGLDVRTAAGRSTLSTRFVEDDPNAWRAPLDTPADIEAGRTLWNTAALTELGFENRTHAIRARCSSCHFTDGYDLAYFNYSNRSIVARSVFHGLSERQGQQIASYIRSLPLQIPAGFTRRDAGRPWNPPFQPGPGLDARPVELWAAGAGLGAVLERDVDMKAFMFPGGQYRPEILGASGFLNPRETPQALQYPDWNAWVPTIAPEDMVTDPARLSASGGVYRFEQARAFVQANRRQMETDRGVRDQALFRIRQFSESRVREGEGFPTRLFYTNRDIPEPMRTPELMMKQTRLNLAYASWFNIRQFELLHRFDLEAWTDKGHAAGSPTVPAGYRSWGQTLRMMFETAPHFVADHAGLTFNFTQPGNYLSTAWYSLEQIVNGGYRAGTFGIDWNYHPFHIMGMHSGGTGFYTDGPIHTYRAAWSILWLYQGVPQMDLLQSPPVPFTPRSFGFYQRQIGQGLDLAYGAEQQVMRGQMTRADWAQLQEALALAFLAVAERYTPDQWVRRTVNDDAHRTADTFETVEYAPRYDPRHAYDLPERGYQADAYYLRIKLLKDNALLTPATLTRLINWGESIWPRGEWAALRR